MIYRFGNFKLFCFGFLDIPFSNEYYHDFSKIRVKMTGSYRQVCIKFKDFSRTSKNFLTVYKDYKVIKNTDLHAKLC